MSRVHALVVFAVLSLLTASANAQNLFSDESLVRRHVPSTQGGQLTPTELRRSLDRAGYEISNVYDDTVFEISAENGDWTFPVLVELSPDESNLWCTALLQELTGRLEDHAPRMQQLMALNGKYGNVFFKMDPDSNMVMLVGSHPNQDLSHAQITELVDLLTSIAVEHEQVWVVASAPAPTGLQADLLYGGWHYQETGRSMELNFRSNGRFTATFEENGSFETYYGNFTLNGDQLQLVTDDEEQIQISVIDLTSGEMLIDVNGARFPMARI